MSSIFAPDLFQQLLTKEGVSLALSLLTLGGGSYWLIKKSHKALSEITPSTRDTLRASALNAGLCWAIGLTPVIFIRKFGWENIGFFYSLYKEILFRNKFTTLLSFLLPILLAAGTVLYPKDSKATKYQLLAATCFSAGMVLAPSFIPPLTIIPQAAAYAAGLVIPVTLSATLSPNFLTLNISSLLGMGIGTLFVNKYGIPICLNRGVADIIIATSPTTRLLVSSVISSSAFFLLAAVNAHILYIEQCQSVQRGDEKEKKWFVIDGTDEIANGMIMAGYSGFTVFRLMSVALKIMKQAVFPSEKENKNLGDQLLDME